MAEIILYPTHKDYCKECIYHTEAKCLNEEYNRNAYKVISVWKHCKYKKKRHTESEAASEL